MDIRSIVWVNNRIRIIDQTKLPVRLEYLYINDVKLLWQAIKELKVRGAPALGVAAGLGCFLGLRHSRAGDYRRFRKDLEAVIKYIGSSRPTARNLFWGLERIREAVLRNKKASVSYLKQLILNEAKALIEEDRTACRRIGSFGASLIKDNSRVLTICNAGILATIDYGTALGVMYRAKEEGRRFEVYACETRPLLQGARLTTWELKKKGIDVTLICDSMAATLMRMKKVDLVITGADRITANGDAANKIGTYNLAVLCQHHRIPFYIAAPASTFDLSLKDGSSIPIEQRQAQEITSLFFKAPIAAKNVKVFNPAFDVTPNRLIAAIVTDRGVIRPPYAKNIRKILKR